MNEGFGNVDAKTAMRMMMDEMMGQNRDATEEEKMEKMHKVYDRGTDKMFTCWGVSVWKLFKDTKSQDWAFNAYRKRGDGDPTDLEASQDCRKQWLELTQEQRDAYGYERELYLLLDDLVTQCDGKIERNLSRIESLHVSVRCCRDDFASHTVVSFAGEPKRRRGRREDAGHPEEIEGEDRYGGAAGRRGMWVRSSLSLVHPDASFVQGEVDHSMAVMQEVETLTDLYRQIQHGSQLHQAGLLRQQTVCEVTGDVIDGSAAGDDAWMQSHFEGKEYVGWKTIRDKLKEMKALRNGQGPPAGLSGFRHDDERSARDLQRRAESSKGGDRDRGRDRDRRRSRSRSRDRRDRDRGRDSRHSYSDRDRDRGRDSRHSYSDRDHRRSDRDGGRRR